ncbi:MAG: hypothetical protein IPJ65_11555 [Archangiaceae bacterium]|nr:hypothetical protein [Archangiaceae bacterium]
MDGVEAMVRRRLAGLPGTPLSIDEWRVYHRVSNKHTEESMTNDEYLSMRERLFRIVEQLPPPLSVDDIELIRFTDVATGIFDETKNIGGVSFNPLAPVAEQIDRICEVLLRKHADSRG